MVVNIAAFTSCYTVCDFCWFMIAYLRNQAQYSAHILFTNDLGPWKYLNYDCGAWNGESESFLNQHMRICVPAISCMHVCVGDGMVFVVSSCFTFFWGCLGSTILPRKEFEPAKLQTKNQRKNGESCARELLEILGINMFLISGPLFKLGYVHVHTLLF